MYLNRKFLVSAVLEWPVVGSIHLAMTLLVILTEQGSVVGQCKQSTIPLFDVFDHPKKIRS